ncbi:tryptophan--tRNA ligase [Candidatus Bathyarchaeota archaeon]|nr:tryptophan--tRNA ligase [Candidatus Bathyarchaeota archaeon]
MVDGLASEEMVVTPWEVAGEIDYSKLIEQFGTQPLTDDLLEELRGYTGELHMQLRRRIFFSHRDLDWLLEKYRMGEKFVLYTGRGPSGNVHLGHVIPWIFTKHLQEKFDAKLYFQLTDDEKFLVSQNLTIRDTLRLAYDNALDVLATGFDVKKTFLISDVRNVQTLYKVAVEVAKHVTYSTAKAVFGFKESSNIGIIFFPAMQAAPCFLESALSGRNVPCLIPAAIDQDPYWRITRDVAPKLNYYKPAQIHCKFLPGLGKGGKMSSSIPETCIFTTDDPEVAAGKIMNAYTGGKATVEEQRRLGANPDICPIYYYEMFLFEQDDLKLAEIGKRCRSGDLLCGEHKASLAPKVERFLKEHQNRREKAKDIVSECFIDPCDRGLQASLGLEMF